MTDNNQSPENLEQVAMALYVYAAELIKEGKSRQEVIDILIKRGIERSSAEIIMSRLNESQISVTRRSGVLHIAFGVLVVALGLLPLFGVIVEQVDGISVIMAILLMAVGVVIIGRGVLKVTAS